MRVSKGGMVMGAWEWLRRWADGTSPTVVPDACEFILELAFFSTLRLFLLFTYTFLGLYAAGMLVNVVGMLAGTDLMGAIEPYFVFVFGASFLGATVTLLPLLIGVCFEGVGSLPVLQSLRRRFCGAVIVVQ